MSDIAVIDAVRIKKDTEVFNVAFCQMTGTLGKGDAKSLEDLKRP